MNFFNHSKMLFKSFSKSSQSFISTSESSQTQSSQSDISADNVSSNSIEMNQSLSQIKLIISCRNPVVRTEAEKQVDEFQIVFESIGKINHKQKEIIAVVGEALREYAKRKAKGMYKFKCGLVFTLVHWIKMFKSLNIYNFQLDNSSEPPAKRKRLVNRSDTSEGTSILKAKES